jgi:DNA-directed RNA polymerase subunit RPC12/RpoP|tara:strand:- start:11362 stop:11757 length:396 start_codon:yes stop_codon:yes gene_type:complete
MGGKATIYAGQNAGRALHVVTGEEDALFQIHGSGPNWTVGGVRLARAELHVLSFQLAAFLSDTEERGDGAEVCEECGGRMETQGLAYCGLTLIGCSDDTLRELWACSDCGAKVATPSEDGAATATVCEGAD